MSCDSRQFLLRRTKWSGDQGKPGKPGHRNIGRGSCVGPPGEVKPPEGRSRKRRSTAGAYTVPGLGSFIRVLHRRRPKEQGATPPRSQVTPACKDYPVRIAKSHSRLRRLSFPRIYICGSHMTHAHKTKTLSRRSRILPQHRARAAPRFFHQSQPPASYPPGSKCWSAGLLFKSPLQRASSGSAWVFQGQWSRPPCVGTATGAPPQPPYGIQAARALL